MGEERKETKKDCTFFPLITNKDNDNNNKIIICVMFLVSSLFSTCFDGNVKLKQATEFLKCIDVKFII